MTRAVIHHPLVACAVVSLLIGCAMAHDRDVSDAFDEHSNASPAQTHQSPTDAFQAFVADLASGNVSSARQRLDVGNPPPQVEAELSAKVQAWSDGVRAGQAMVPVAERMDDECALVIVHDQPAAGARPAFIDLDPVFLRRSGDDWLIMMESPLRPNRFMMISPEEMARFRSLQAWFENEQPTLQSALRDQQTRGEQP